MDNRITPSDISKFKDQLARQRKAMGSFDSIEKSLGWPKGYLTKYANGTLKITPEVEQQLLPEMRKHNFKGSSTKKKET